MDVWFVRWIWLKEISMFEHCGNAHAGFINAKMDYSCPAGTFADGVPIGYHPNITTTGFGALWRRYLSEMALEKHTHLLCSIFIVIPAWVR